MTAIIIDYGMGNLGSIHHSLELCGGGDVAVSQDPADLKTASAIILPGVGAFPVGMANLHERGWVTALREEVLGNSIPFLGVCLGMQLLAENGSEGERSTPGLGFIKGDVIKFEPTSAQEKIPHIGWNEVQQKQPHPVFEGIANNKDFYFVHSYHFAAADEKDVIATTPYCGEFVAAVAHKNVIGMQFHPEKSQVVGFQLLKNFLQRC